MLSLFCFHPVICIKYFKEAAYPDHILCNVDEKSLYEILFNPYRFILKLLSFFFYPVICIKYFKETSHPDDILCSVDEKSFYEILLLIFTELF